MLRKIEHVLRWSVNRVGARILSAVLPAAWLLSGCGVRQGSPVAVVPAGQQGVVHGGQQPVVGATVQLYAVGTAGDGSAATPLLSPAPVTDANGGFHITGTYVCPSPSTLVYIVATGGNPGLSGSVNNADLAMMAALGPCGNLTSSTFISVNEVTTVAGVYALAPFLASASHVGSASADAAALSAAFVTAAELADTSTGMSPGVGVPVGTAVPVAQINTIADIVAPCINSAGGVAGDGSACGNLLSLTSVAGMPPPTDTVGALLLLAKDPGMNTAGLYGLVAGIGPFQPTVTQTPTDLAVRLTVPGGLTVTPAVLNFPATRVGTTSAPVTLTLTNNTAVPIGVDLPVTSGLNPQLTGDNPGDFQNTDHVLFSCVTPIQPGASCTESFTFAPTTTGTRSAYLIVNNTSPDPVIGIPLTGDGLGATVAGPIYLTVPSADENFLGLDVVGFTSAGTGIDATLANNGTTPLTIDGISISNDPTLGQPEFTETTTCGATLAAGAQCTISMSAQATALPFTTGILTVYDDATGGPQTLNLAYANGFTGTNGIILNLGSRSIGTQESVSSNGNIIGGPLGATLNLTISGPNASDFSIPAASSTCTISRFAPKCPLTVTFAPTALGVRVATVNINGVPYGGVIGTGLPPGVQFEMRFNNFPIPPPYDLGQVVVGKAYHTGVVVVNTGTVPLQLNAPVVSGANANQFQVTSQCTASVAPNGTCVISINGVPTMQNNDTATLTLTDSTNAMQQTMRLKMTGVNPAPAANPTSLSFAYTPLGSVSASQTITVTAYNNDPVNASIASVNEPFVVTGASSCTSTPCQISVAFAPTALNTQGQTGQPTVFGDLRLVDPNSSQSTLVSLSGAMQ